MDRQMDSAPARIDSVPVDQLHRRLGWHEPLHYPAAWRDRPIAEWTMESDDFILRYLFRHARPGRHLEFGTWEGDGVIRCAEECDATIWTINVLKGEAKESGDWAYAACNLPLPEHASANALERLETGSGTWIRTDAFGMIGHKYLQRGLGDRVCQIFSDSRTWDTRHYPEGFFDTIFVDGGHAGDIVAADTATSIRLVKPGGLVVWHDFCPRAEALSISPVAKGVAEAIADQEDLLAAHFDPLFWIEPSWLLVGVRRAADR